MLESNLPMSRNSTASSALSRILLAAMLCLLAMAFAMEAKMAWYRPAGGRYRDVSGAKALPINNPRLVSHGVPAPDPVHPEMLAAVLPCLIMLCPVFFDRRSRLAGLRTGSRVSAADYFSPPIFLRPPPAF